MSGNTINFREMERKWKDFWEKEKIFKSDFSKQEIYSIDTPPPTVSGKMHIGHAFSYSHQDFIARFRRMFLINKNKGVFYPFGTDDNGLPTERLVEKLNKIKSKELSRAEFIDLCIKTLKEVTPGFIQEWKDLGMSCDFEMYYSTIDENSRRISQEFFIDLFNKKEIYRKEFPTIWCPECQTSIAQAELEDKKEKSYFSTLKFSCEGKDLLISTTRPELLGACVCVFVHPSDKRYKNLIGKKARVPLFNFEVPIISDSSADPEKGTGVLMVCSYGDKYDVDAINRHKLIPKIIFDKSGRISEGEYMGLKVKEARKKILEDLKNKNLIYEQKEIEHFVNVHDKCGTPIEFLTTEQWFIKILDKKDALIKQGNKIKWHPEFMKKRYDNWVKGLEWDWNISRERHFGVPIPVWECKNCNELILPDKKELPIDPLQKEKKCPKCKKIATPEKKVLDTWATSSLTPQILFFLTDKKIKIPYSLRPQGHDIIRTWAFYTIVREFLIDKKIPWKEIFISGNVSLGGEKMSKSKGNTIDPHDVLEKYGADALRFWAGNCKLGNDMDYQEKDLITAKKMINKLLNASKFVFIGLKDYDKKIPKKIEPLDRLFLDRISFLIDKSTKNFLNYEYSKVKQDVEKFFLSDFCDNYLEIVKKRVYQGIGDKKLSVQYTLYNSLLTILKLISPIMPFVTEEIYQEYFRKYEKVKSIHLSGWPEKEKINESPDFNIIVKNLSFVRQEKSKKNISLNSPIKEFITPDYEILDKYKEDFISAIGALNIKQGKENKVIFMD